MTVHADAKEPSSLLPLHAMPPTELALPALSATPDEVRRFLVTSQRKLTPQHAEIIARSWTIGSGNEVRTYCIAMYQRIFGLENGSILFTDIHRIIWANKVKVQEAKNLNLKKSKWAELRDRTGVRVANLVFLVIVFIYASTWAWNKNEEADATGGKNYYVWGFVLSTFAAFLTFFEMCRQVLSMDTEPEDHVNWLYITVPPHKPAQD